MAASVRCAWGDEGRRAGTIGAVIMIGVICAKKKFGICQSVFIVWLASVIDNALRDGKANHDAISERSSVSVNYTCNEPASSGNGE